MMTKPLSTNQLLDMYHTYKELTDKLSSLEATLARLLLTGQDASATKRELLLLAQERVKLSDAMTFDTPRIWVEYKYRAYQNDSQPIRTMHDLRLHCSKPDYICTKRYTFLNAMLIEEGKASLGDRTIYADSESLASLLDQTTLDDLKPQVYEMWRSHEYYTEDGHVLKWDNFNTVTT